MGDRVREAGDGSERCDGGGPNGEGGSTALYDRAPFDEQPGDRIGPYRLLEKIAEGGFGVVFLAERRQPYRQKVALKVLKPGMDSRAILARFDAERQALALLDHPNTAKVLDAGATEKGRPYFVMEHVAGKPITTFCDDHKLSLRKRLKLFLLVCGAIQHAHSRGIVHRDIKPSNILVKLSGTRVTPKVIDFGIAKAIAHPLTEQTLHTFQNQILGTFEYMSPEQAENSPLGIDERADVYSLGVLLYEMIAGAVPLEREALLSKGVYEFPRMLRETRITRPSMKVTSTPGLRARSRERGVEPKGLLEQLRSGLDDIVMSAVEKDRLRRTESANVLMAQLVGFLYPGRQASNLPTAARDAVQSWRTVLLTRRGQLSAFAGVACVLVLIVLAGGGYFRRVGGPTTSVRRPPRPSAEIRTADVRRACDEFDAWGQDLVRWWGSSSTDRPRDLRLDDLMRQLRAPSPSLRRVATTARGESAQVPIELRTEATNLTRSITEAQRRLDEWSMRLETVASNWEREGWTDLAEAARAHLAALRAEYGPGARATAETLSMRLDETKEILQAVDAVVAGRAEARNSIAQLRFLTLDLDEICKSAAVAEAPAHATLGARLTALAGSLKGMRDRAQTGAERCQVLEDTCALQEAWRARGWGAACAALQELCARARGAMKEWIGAFAGEDTVIPELPPMEEAASLERDWRSVGEAIAVFKATSDAVLARFEALAATELALAAERSHEDPVGGMAVAASELSDLAGSLAEAVRARAPGWDVAGFQESKVYKQLAAAPPTREVYSKWLQEASNLRYQPPGKSPVPEWARRKLAELNSAENDLRSWSPTSSHWRTIKQQLEFRLKSRREDVSNLELRPWTRASETDLRNAMRDIDQQVRNLVDETKEARKQAKDR
jgi:serine/threonine protein kinase